MFGLSRVGMGGESSGLTSVWRRFACGKQGATYKCTGCGDIRCDSAMYSGAMGHRKGSGILDGTCLIYVRGVQRNKLNLSQYSHQSRHRA